MYFSRKHLEFVSFSSSETILCIVQHWLESFVDKLFASMFDLFSFGMNDFHPKDFSENKYSLSVGAMVVT